ncbi:MAG TPA: efflux RND transporter periplasmic adaptor subunit [Acidobacteriaceae bacterium]|nr:efflux RND transporter periplasmic adaptor subunit [Acidobacteriaceae bacterium]
MTQLISLYSTMRREGILRLARVLAAVGLGLMANAQTPQKSSVHLRYVTAQLSAVTPDLEAYGQVEPIAVVPVSAAQTGVVAGLKVVPGMHVRAGQELAHLNGPEINSLLMQSQADVRSTQAQLNATQKSLEIQKQQLAAHLSTRQVVHQAESAVAQAQTSWDNAQARLRAARQMMTISAPANATVLTLNAADGALVSAGQPIVTLQTVSQLWLKASYYGADLGAIRIGMAGSFVPADSTQAIPVKVSAVFGSMMSGGGESIALVSTNPKSRWINGEFGKVTLYAAQRKLVAVPTRALILDQGKWWVMVHTPNGDRPQAVVPGPARGWQTFLEAGLNPGAQIVVANAYLLFHRGISKNFQLPD